MPIAEAHPMQPVVVRHQRAVVAEPRREDELQRPRPQRPVRRAEASRRRARKGHDRLDRPLQDRPLLVDRELREVLVEPAVDADLVPGTHELPGELRPRLERVPGREDRRWDALRGEQLQQPRHPDPGPELAVGHLDRWVATPDRVGDEVGIDRQRDGQSRLVHPA